MIHLRGPVGVFIFEPGVKLSHAKLVRDTIQGQILNPKDFARSLPVAIQNGDDARGYIGGSYVNGRPLKEVKFAFVPA